EPISEPIAASRKPTLRRSVAGVLAVGALLAGTAGVIGAAIVLAAGPAYATPEGSQCGKQARTAAPHRDQRTQPFSTIRAWESRAPRSVMSAHHRAYFVQGLLGDLVGVLVPPTHYRLDIAGIRRR
ncbi:hypothetical protein, partial [Rhodococcus sp. BS-15]|uniref:hypothetical protein n=1 Tax=Rhodococcus sp. BS-15 TaxID=1304954 RepID=UPI0035B5194C